jgi:hypothetical protein
MKRLSGDSVGLHIIRSVLYAIHYESPYGGLLAR